MKLHVTKRSIKTAYQTALAIAAEQGLEILASGEWGYGIQVAIITALAAFFSALENGMRNRKREGPVEDS